MDTITPQYSATNMALSAVDAWFGDKIKTLCENHHSSNIAGNPQLKQAAAGIALAMHTRDEMIKLIESPQ